MLSRPLTNSIVVQTRRDGRRDSRVAEVKRRPAVAGDGRPDGDVC